MRALVASLLLVTAACAGTVADPERCAYAPLATDSNDHWCGSSRTAVACMVGVAPVDAPLNLCTMNGASCAPSEARARACGPVLAVTDGLAISCCDGVQ